MKIQSFLDKLLDGVKEFWLALSNRETPFISKVLAALAFGYVISPIDIMPDFIPLYGFIDDIIAAVLLIYFAKLLIPDEIKEQCIDEAKDFYFKPTKKAILLIIMLIVWIIFSITFMFILTHN